MVARFRCSGTYGREEKKPTPTCAEFWKDFYDAYVLTENKTSEHGAKERICRNHIEPHFGRLRIDEIGAEHVAKFKAAKLKDAYNRKSITNQLAVLRRMLAVAVEWGRIPHMPGAKWQLRAPAPPFDFLTFDEAPRLVEAARGMWRGRCCRRIPARHREWLSPGRETAARAPVKCCGVDGCA
jgi:integrase